MWLKKLFGIKTGLTKQVKKEEIKNEVSIQFGPEKTPTKNKWLHPIDNFGKLKRGTQSRSGYKTKIGFEGGQMPLQRRVPKFGFKNINRVDYKAVNIASLEMLASEKGITEFNLEVFMDNGLTSRNDLVKILGRGELKSKINVSANGFSKAAIAAIEAQGGACTKI